MQRFDTVIFDLDGTLLDTLADLADSVNFALAAYGFPARTVQEVRSFVGNGVARLMELAVPAGRENSQYEACLADFRKHYSANMQNKTEAYAGIMETLAQLKAGQYKMAIVSNKFDAAVKELNSVYFAEYIQVAIGEASGVAKKPAPDTVFKAMQELGASKGSTVYIGDSEVDVKTAKNAGVTCIGVTWGFRDRAVLEEAGADYIVDTTAALLPIIKG